MQSQDSNFDINTITIGAIVLLWAIGVGVAILDYLHAI